MLSLTYNSSPPTWGGNLPDTKPRGVQPVMCHAAGEVALRDVVSGCGGDGLGLDSGILEVFSNLDFDSRMGENEEAFEMQPLLQVEPMEKGFGLHPCRTAHWGREGFQVLSSLTLRQALLLRVIPTLRGKGSAPHC